MLSNIKRPFRKIVSLIFLFLALNFNFIILEMWSVLNTNVAKVEHIFTKKATYNLMSTPAKN